MSDVPDGESRAFHGGRPRARAATAALGVCVGGFVAGVVGIIVTRLVVSVVGVADTDAFRVLAGNQIQVGFAAFAVGYLLLSDDLERYVKLRRPTWEDVAWILALPLVFVVVLPPVLGAVSAVAAQALPVAGFSHATLETAGDAVALANRPGLWPVAFVGLYLFAAPAEELVYRGIVQGRLRESFDTAGVVLGGGLLFGLMHVLVGLLTPAVGPGGTLYWGVEATAAGVVWGYAYERTGNLLVTAVTHAMMWTVPFSALLPGW